MDAEKLRDKITSSLKDQGFHFDDGAVKPPEDLSKEKIRDLHKPAVSAKREKLKKYYAPSEDQYLQYVADGDEVIPEDLSPKFVRVRDAHSDWAELFRWVTLHWSIPVSSGYGRRLRYLIFDASNSKLIGLFGLGDPVYGLKDRDEWIGWNQETRKQNLKHVLDAFVLGAVPPYSRLLGGKLVAMLAASNKVRTDFEEKYRGRTSNISEAEHDGRVALLTTTSALGRSSIYNRIRLEGRTMYHRIGTTSGSGEFHFSNGLYGKIRQFVEEHSEPTLKNENWGDGFRNRREVVKKCLQILELPTQWLYHGIEREVYAVPLAENTREFLRNDETQPSLYDHSVTRLFEWFRQRWLLPRAERVPDYNKFRAEEYRIWDDE